MYVYMYICTDESHAYIPTCVYTYTFLMYEVLPNNKLMRGLVCPSKSAVGRHGSMHVASCGRLTNEESSVCTTLAGNVCNVQVLCFRIKKRGAGPALHPKLLSQWPEPTGAASAMPNNAEAWV